VLQVLKNPAYAGAYVHGRHVTRKTVDADGNVRTVTTEVPRALWAVVIKDHHPGYLTWEEYLAIEARLAANHTGGGGRPVREGTALCQGIIICGGCGGPMAANYHGDDRASYRWFVETGALICTSCFHLRRCFPSAADSRGRDLHPSLI